MKLKRLLCSASFALLAVGVISFGASAYANSKNAHVHEAEASSASYWASISQSAISEGGETLMNALQAKISNATELSYSALWTAYQTTDIVPGKSNKIWDMYGGFQFTYGTQQAGSYKKEGDVYNREHSIPKSWFSEAKPMYTDLVHLIPTDGKVNGMRSAHALGEVDTSSYSYPFGAQYDGNNNLIQTAGISKVGNAKAINGVQCSSATVYEPDDQYKGDLARIYMYFVTRYGNVAASGEGLNNFKNTFPYFSSYGLAMIKKWHVQDPVSQKELDRNDGIETVQGNRNPFVDHPEWGDKIFETNYEETHGGGGGSSDALTITASETSVTVGDTVNLSASIQSGTSRNLQWFMYADGASYGSLTSTSGYSSSFVTSAEGTVTIGCKTVDNEDPYLSDSVTVTINSSGGGGGGGGGGESSEGLIEFGSASEKTNVNSASVKGDDSAGNEWTITTQGTNSFTQNTAYSQIGSGNNPATSITFTTTLSSTCNVTAMSAKFGGFNSTAGTITLKVGNTTIGTGSLNGSNDVTVNNSTTASGTVLTVTVTNISRGIKAYYISYTAESSSGGKVLSSITLSGDYTTEYDYNYSGTFSFDGVCTAHYSDSSSAIVTPTSVEEPDFTDVSEQTVTVSYTEGGVTKTTTYTITVEKGTLSSISLNTTNCQKSFYVGNTFNSDGLVVTANYSTGYSATVTPTSVSSPNMSSAGNKTVTVSYTEGGTTKSSSYQITVSNDTLQSIDVDATNAKTSYYVGDTFSSSGVVVTAHYASGNSQDVSSSVSFSGYNMSSAGNQTVTVTYQGQTDTYSIKVSEDSITSISLAGTYKTSFEINEPFTYAGLTVTAHYASGKEETGLTPTSVSSPIMSTAGQKTVIVTYGGQSTSYTITVTDPSANNPTIEVPAGDGTSIYSRITSALDVSEGDYLIVYETNSVALNSALSPIDAASNTINVNITNNTIPSNATTDAVAFTFVACEEGYGIKTPNDTYIGATSSGKLYTNATLGQSGYVNTVSFDGNNAVISTTYSTNTFTLKFNNASGQTRFRYYSTGQQPIQLYKKTTTGGSTKTVEVTSISSTCNVDAYHPGETPTLSDFTVIANYTDNGAKTYTLTGSDYAQYLSLDASMVTYSDAPSGGTTATKQVTVSFSEPSAKVLSENKNVNVSRSDYDRYTERLNYVNLFSQLEATSYSEVKANGETITAFETDYFVSKGYKYNGGQQMSFSYSGSGNSKTTQGYIQNSEALKNPIKSVSVDGTISFDIQYSTDGSSFVSSMQSNQDYYYFKVYKSGTFSASYASINYIDVTLESPDNSISALVNYVMYEDTEGQCDSKTGVAIGIFEGMSGEEKEAFLVTSQDYCVVQARARFNDWLKAKGKVITGSNGDYVISSRNSNILGMVNKAEIITLSTIIIISGIVFSSLVSYFVIKKRKEDK